MPLTRYTPPARAGRRLAAAVAATVVVGLILAPSPMQADSASVVVTARISPTFSLSLLSSGRVDFGTVSLGSTHTSTEPQVLQVRSNRPWEFVDSSDTMIEIGELVIPRERILRHESTMAFGTDLPPGVHTIECDYTLDLATPDAFDISPDAEISATFGYTAIQR